MEFALVLPVMILFSMGVAEVGRFALLNLKLQHAATTMADLAARDKFGERRRDDEHHGCHGLCRPAVRSRYAGPGDRLLRRDGRGWWVPTVLAQAEGGGALDETSAVGSLDGVATLPGDLILRDGERVVFAEAIFHSTPWLLALVPESLLRRIAYYRPRLARLRAAPSD